MSEDFPAEGMPTSAASAMSFISSSTHCSCEGSPNSANAGARRVDVTKCTFPRPPTPPSATVMRSPSCVRSAMSSPVSFVSSKYSWTTVPTGTFKIDVLAVGAAHARALAVHAALGLEVVLEAVVDQRRDAQVGLDDDVAAVTAVAAVGAAFGDVRLATEGHAARAAVAAFDVYAYLVYEHGDP